MSACVWRDDVVPCERTDIKARGLCKAHYLRARHHRRLDDYDTLPPPPRPTVDCAWCGRPFVPHHGYERHCSMACAHPTFEQVRDAGRLVCYCTTPDGPPDDECARCRRPILTPDRIAYLAAKYGLAVAS